MWRTKTETAKTDRMKATGIITLRTERGWEPWGIGTFREALAAKEEAGATGLAFCPVRTVRKGGAR